MFTLQTKTEIVLDIVIAAAFVASFYFTISKNLEKKSVTRNVTNIVDQVLPDVSNWTGTSLGRQLQPVVCNALASVNVNTDESAQNDAAVEQHNDDLIKKSVKAFGMIIGGGLLMALYFYSKRSPLNPVNVHEVLIHCVVMLVTIAAAEFLFFSTTVGNAVFANADDIVSIYAGRA